MPTSRKNLTQPQLEYLPAVLKAYKGNWLIEYWALNPQKNELVRKQIRLNKVRKRYSKLADFRVYANQIVCTINAKLMGGWNPLMEEENSRLYTPLSVVVEKYLDEKKRELRPDTMRSYSSFCKLFMEWCDENAPKIYSSLFNRVLAIKYMDYFYNVRKVSARTYNNQLKMGRALFNFAKEKCYVKENPFELIHPKREQQKRRILIPREVRTTITEYLQEKKSPFLIVCQLVFTSLIRPKEIRMVKLKDVDLERKMIRIPSENAKTHNERFSAMNEQLYENLSSLHIERYPASYYLFGEDLLPAKTPCGQARFRKEWEKVRSALKLPKEMQLYSFRDTGINNMLKSGVDPLTVMQHADHHDLSMTTRYANHADEKLIETIYNNAPDF